MFNNAKNLYKNRKMVKLVTIITILVLTINILFQFINEKNVYASQERLALSERINNYPGYADLINKVKKSHPNWQIKILYTGLDWNQVIKNETTAWHGRNLIDASKTGDWICPTCSDKKYDNGSWKCASEATVSYYMDPRNFLNDENIFQFEESIFNSSVHSVEGIMSLTQNTFLSGKENAEAILNACKNVNINPYQVTTRIIQEQGYSGTTMSKGNNGWYNLFNVGASGNSVSQIIANATEYAKNSGWNTLAKSIVGGIDVLKSKYIGIGQNTLYLQKFDVDSSDGTLYYHQYMQNVSAAYSEAILLKNIYKNVGTYEGSLSFVIPVYENMPSEKSPLPGTQWIVTQNVKIKGNDINIRERKSVDSNVIAKLNSQDIILRIEIGNMPENGYKWDKVVLSNGKKGYVASDLVEKVNDVTNCNESVIVNESVNLRNGPGTSDTSIITTLIQGQALTRIEKGKYNGLDGYNWDRVMLADGRQGYLANEFIDIASNSNSGSKSSSNNELIKVVTGDGLTVRENPGTDKRVLTYLSYNEIATRVESEVSTANGYTWDKIVTSSGVIGYVARGNSKEKFIESISQNNENQVNNNANNNVDTNIKTDKKTGDVNGDGKISPTDYSLIKDHIMGKSQLNEEQKFIADYNKDGKISPTDYALIKEFIMR